MKHKNVSAYKKEFRYKVKTDGSIIIKDNDKIIKRKPPQKLTVDLIYDDTVRVFLDMDRNVYKYAKTINEIKTLTIIKNT